MYDKKRTSVSIGPPISKNKMYTVSKKYGLVKSAHYRKWIETNLPIVKSGLDRPEKFPIQVEILVVDGLGFTDSNDIDNINKSVMDLLVRAEIIPDDNVKYVSQTTERHLGSWTRKSAALTQITYWEPDL